MFRHPLRRGWVTYTNAARAALVCGLLVTLAACGQDGATPPPATRPTATGQTVADLTATATTGAVPTLPPDTPTPTPEAATATPEPSTATATATAGPCASDAEFISDLTVPDGAQFLPGQPIAKQWSVRNNGTCDWNADYRLVLVSGNALGARSELALYPARAGATAVLEVGMVAPAEPGSYTGRWQARDAEGNLFGDRIFITIEVINPAPPTDTPAP